MTFVFPQPRQLKCFQNPHLYFSLLPRDILNYCLQPLLTWDSSPFLWDERWIEPVLVKSFPFPPMDGRQGQLILKNGNCLFMSQRSHLRVYSCQDGLHLWTLQLENICRVRYYFLEDVLYLTTGSPSQEYFLRAVTQISSDEEATNRLQIASDRDLAEKDTYFNYPFPEEYECQLEQIISTITQNGMSRQSYTFIGGYLILEMQDRLDYYRCVE